MATHRRKRRVQLKRGERLGQVEEVIDEDAGQHVRVVGGPVDVGARLVQLLQRLHLAGRGRDAEDALDRVVTLLVQRRNRGLAGRNVRRPN